MKGTFVSYAKTRFRRLRDHLHTLETSADQEILHQVRIELKKIRALLRLVHFHRRKFRDHGAFQQLKQLHRVCGDIRDPGVIGALITQASGEPGVGVRESTERFTEFQAQIPGYIDMLATEEKRILKQVRRLKKGTYRKFLRKRKKKLKTLLIPKIRRKELHESRKLIKEILFLYLIFRKRKQVNPFYARSAEVIGNWHDKAMVIQSLSNTRESYAELIEDLQRQARTDVSRLKKLIRKFYKR